MGNNNTQNQNRGMLDSQRTGSDAAYNRFLSPVAAGMERAIPESQNLRGEILDNYRQSTMPSGLVPNSQGWFNLPDMGGGGGGVGADFSSAKSGYQSMADTGGDFGEAEGLYRGLSFDPTGLRYRATSVIPGMYDSFKNSLNRRQNVQGGYSPGFDAQSAELLRQKGREGYHASRDVEADIANIGLDVSKTRAAGLTGIAGARAGNKLQALGGLAGIAGNEGALSVSRAGLDESRANRNMGAQLSLIDAYMRDKSGRNAGMAEMYRSAPGDVGQFMNAYLQGLGGQTGNQLQNLGIRSGIQNNPGFMQYLPGLLGGAGSIMTGLGGVPGFGQPKGDTIQDNERYSGGR